MIRILLLALMSLAVLGVRPVAASQCYGPVGKNETLWPIALRLRSDPSVSPHRMMLSLLEASPEAFSHHNVNTLESGTTLCFEPEDLIGLDDDAAIEEVHRQNQEWKAGRMRVAADSVEPLAAPLAQAGDDEAAATRTARLATNFEARLARIESRVAFIEEQLRDLATRVGAPLPSGGHEAMRPTPAPQGLEPMPTPARKAMRQCRCPRRRRKRRWSPCRHLRRKATRPWNRCRRRLRRRPMHAWPQGLEAMEPMPTPAPQSDEAMEPMPTPAPQTHEAMEPMPTPAPQGEEAMEPMPTPAPQGDEAMEPMPTPAPQGHEAMEPMPTPAPASTDQLDAGTLTTESVSARIAKWRERVRELRKR